MAVKSFEVPLVSSDKHHNSVQYNASTTCLCQCTSTLCNLHCVVVVNQPLAHRELEHYQYHKLLHRLHSFCRCCNNPTIGLGDRIHALGATLVLLLQLFYTLVWYSRIQTCGIDSEVVIKINEPRTAAYTMSS